MTDSKSWSVNEEDDQEWDDLFVISAEDVGDYLKPEGPKGEMQDIGSFDRIEVATHGDETEEMEILGLLKPLQRTFLSRLLLWISRLLKQLLQKCLLLRFLLRLKLTLPNTPPLGMSLLKLSKVRLLALRLPSQPQSLQEMTEIF